MATGLFTLRQVLQGIRQGAWTGNIAPKWVEYLVVAGGGGAQYGGGGAGGLLAGILAVTPGATLTVTVGAGGAANTVSTGSNSVFGSITALGGGNGNIPGVSGGSGGGSWNVSAGGQGTFGQGNAGGYSPASVASGGGGAGTIGLGTNNASGYGGNGGAGIASAINGTITTYAGGGGGYGGTTAGVGGVGGGGNGSTTTTPVAGTVNTGGGAGGGTAGGLGTGGSGIVIVRYPGSTQFYTGGTVWASYNGYVVHVFTATGTLAPTTPTAIKPQPVAIGAAYGGGYFAGQITQSGTVYNLVVCDKTVGQSTLKKWGTYNVTTGITSVINGPVNSAAMAALGAAYEGAVFCEAVNSGGYTDWYLPAQNELEVCYFFLRPGTLSDYTNRSTGTSGQNANAVAPEPISTTYTATVPGQTSATAFRTGASSQEFPELYHWSSSENNATDAWVQQFGGGTGGDAGGLQFSMAKSETRHVRAIRRVAA